MNDVYKKLEQIYQELYYIPNSVHVVHIGSLICQVRETLEALEAKQKIWEAKEASQEVQPEQEHLTPNNDPKLPEREQSQRIRNRSKQYIVSVPEGLEDMGDSIAQALVDGKSVSHPNLIKIQVVDL